MKFIDQTGYELRLSANPTRIISVVPSQTELLFDLGLDKEVVGITKFCLHPEAWFRSKERVGGTKKLDIGKIRALKPDLVIANKEENTREDIEDIRSFCPVWTSDIADIEDALEMIGRVAELVGRQVEGLELQEEISSTFKNIPSFGLKAAYLIWKDPYMAAGGLTYISSMMQACGLTNVFMDRTRYPKISIRDLHAAQPDLLLLSSEPYPFKLNDLQELHQVLQNVKIVLVDGEMFSWYGSRMKYFCDYVTKILESK